MAGNCVGLMFFFRASAGKYAPLWNETRITFFKRTDFAVCLRYVVRALVEDAEKRLGYEAPVGGNTDRQCKFAVELLEQRLGALPVARFTALIWADVGYHCSQG